MVDRMRERNANTKSFYKLTEEGRSYLDTGFPEIRLVHILKEGKPVGIDEARKELKEDLEISIQWAKKKKLVVLKDGKLYLTKRSDSPDEADILKRVARGEKVDEDDMKKLVNRKLVKKVVRGEVDELVGKEVAELTPELLKTGLWEKVRFKPYNVEVLGKKLYPGKLHILTIFEEKIRRTYLDLGFTEAEGPLVESSFWNFDALFQPQDHPARDLADTFYMKIPEKSKLPSGLVESVKKVHEDGGNTGSTGWRYEWSKHMAMKNILRTHTTAVSVRELSKLEPPAKRFCIGRVYRNETIDYKHLPEFVQVDGIVVDENVNFRDLLGYLKEFYRRLGFRKIRFTPSFFPYTEMSTQIEVYFEDRNEWLELGGSGIFRPEVTEPLGITEPVLAWGLGFERPIILKLGLNDIRNFYYRNDLKLLREVSVLQ